ncbi:MAG: hypothetical protein AAF802_24615 [Planctomycetota bacterium]
MSRRVKPPINSEAAASADRKVPNPKDAASKSAWMDAYEEAGGETEDSSEGQTAVDSAVQSCPLPTIDLDYRYSDGSGVANAKYHVYSVGEDGEPDGVFDEEGTLNGEGKKHITGFPEIVQLRYEFYGDPKTYEIKPDERPSATPDKQATTSALDSVGQWIWGTIQGDFNKDQSISQLAVNTLLGLIPIVDQVLDVRDIIAGLKDIILFYMMDEEEQAEQEDVLGISYELWIWINVFIIALGSIPIVGSAVKGVVKGILHYLKQLGKVAGDLSPNQLRHLWEVTVSILNKFGVGNAHKWLKEFPGKLDGWMDEAATKVRGGLDAIKQMIDSAKDYAGRFKRLIGDERSAEVIRKADEYLEAVNKAYSRLDQMKAQANRWIKEQVDKILGGKHRSESTGSTGTNASPVNNSRQQVETDPSESAAAAKATDPWLRAAERGEIAVDPNDVRFTQTSAGGGNPPRAPDLRKKLESGWDPDQGPIDVIDTPDGLLSLDNTRVAVAQEKGIPKITARVRQPDELLPDDFPEPRLRSFNRKAKKLKMDPPKTWGDLFEIRTRDNGLPSTGTTTRPSMPE